MQKPSSSEWGDPTARWRKTFVLPSLALAGAVALVALDSREERVLLADEGTTADKDNDLDGLPDVQEVVLGTDPTEWDTDADGFSDLEELARQSNPQDDLSLPLDSPVNVGMAARAEDGVLTVTTAVYLRHTETGGFNVGLGIFANGVLAELPPQIYLANATVDILPGKVPGDLIGVLQTPYPEVAAHTVGKLSFWSVVTPTGADDPTAADVIDLVSDPEGPALVSLETHPDKTHVTIYRPITPEAPTAAWTPGQLCEQVSLTVGSVGPVVEHLIEAAECEAADGYCTPACASLVGTSFQTIDPLALLGG